MAALSGDLDAHDFRLGAATATATNPILVLLPNLKKPLLALFQSKNLFCFFENLYKKSRNFI